MSDLAQNFGRRVRELRTSLGMTQPQLAEAIEMSVEWVRRIENGGASPSFDTISALAIALHVAPADLFADKKIQPTDQLALAMQGLSDEQVAWLLEGARMLQAPALGPRDGSGAALGGQRKPKR